MAVSRLSIAKLLELVNIEFKYFNLFIIHRVEIVA